MAKLNEREVTCARFHQVIHFLGPGNVGSTIDVNSNLKQTLQGVTMLKTEDGLYISGVTDNKPWEGFVPNGNIVSLQFKTIERSQAI